MALKPSMPPAHKATRFNPTAMAIGASALIAIVLGTLLTGSPFRAIRLAYLDYSNTPAAGAPKADPAPVKAQ